MRSIASYLILYCVMLFAGAAVAAEGNAGPWTVDVTPNAGNTVKGSTVAYPDVLSVKDGKLISQAAGKQGFAPGVCTVKTEGGKTTLSADLVSPKHGKNHYELQLQNNTLSGTMVWSKVGEDGKPKQAEFTLKTAAK